MSAPDGNAADRKDKVWQSASLVKMYLAGVRGAIPLAAEQIDVMLRIVGATGRPVRRFLDLGCGSGTLGAAIARAHADARGVLLDFSEPMLEAARKELAELAPRLEFVRADYADPAWVAQVVASSPFDAVVSGFSIHHQPDERKQHLYREVFCLLAPGGVFVNIEHVASPTPWLESLFHEHFIDALYAFARGQDPAARRDEVAKTYVDRRDKEANLLAPVELQCQWLREIGFHDVDCYLKVFELAVFGGRKPAVHEDATAKA